MVLPANERAVDLFLGTRSQWSSGFGVMGLDYRGVQAVMEIYHSDLSGDQRAELFEKLQIMEFEALNQKS